MIVEPFFGENTGIFYHGDEIEAWRKLGVNILGAVSIIAWSGFWSFLVFGVLKSHNLLRVDDYTEVHGHDLLHHGEAAYPLDAWLEHQYENQPFEKSAVLDGSMSKVKDLSKEMSSEKHLSKEVHNATSLDKPDGKEAYGPLSVDGLRKNSKILTVASFMTNSFRNSHDRLRHFSNLSNLTNTQGEVNIGYGEDISVYSEAQKPRKVSSTTQTTTDESNQTMSVADSLSNIGISRDSIVDLEEMKNSFDRISLGCIEV